MGHKHQVRIARFRCALAVLAALASLAASARAESDLDRDADRDGMDDAEERRLVANHLPWFHIDAGETDASAAPALAALADDPRETLLGDAPAERLASNCAWPLTPRRRGIALARVTPAAPYAALAWDASASPPGLRRVEGSVDAGRIAAQASRRGYVVARVSLVFAHDCGGTGRGLGAIGRGVNAHAGDTESIALSLVRDTTCLPLEQGGATPGGDGWRVLEMVAVTHVGAERFGFPFESIARQRIDACDYGARFDPGLPSAFAAGGADALAWDDAWNADPTRAPAELRSHRNLLWLAMWKHGAYTSRAACNAGMALPFVGPLEECRIGGYVQGFDVANVGEPDDPIDPDDPVNQPETREAGRFEALFPGEGPWQRRAASAPDAGDDGFCGGFERAKVLAAGQRCMGDPIRHKLEGDLSSVGEALLPGYGRCPDGARCHRLLLPDAPWPERQPPFVTQLQPRSGPAAGGVAVTLRGGFPADLCRLRFGAQTIEPALRPGAFMQQLRVVAPPAAASDPAWDGSGRSVPIVLETCAGLRTLETTRGAADWFEYRPGAEQPTP